VGEPARHFRPAWAEVDLGAIRANASALAAAAAPAQLCAVVKANGYGHGAVPAARAALAGGATWLAVALVEEGRELRDAGIGAPILLLSEPVPDAMDEVVACDLTPTLYSRPAAAALERAARASDRTLDVHFKIDTGMHRVGASPAHAVEAIRAVISSGVLRLAGVWTHLAVADEPEDGFTEHQLQVLEGVRADLEALGIRPPLVHAANSAGALLHPRSRGDLVRCGIGLYGYAPAPGLDGGLRLRPALALKARVTLARGVAAGDRVSYGLRYRLDADSVVATVPLGYADGVPRRLSATGAHVLIRGRRRPVAGTITMDQLMVDCGPGGGVAAGDEVVLLGDQQGLRITAEDWASRLDTISYEIVCGIGPRVPRVYVGGP